MQRTADFHDEITDANLPEAARVVDDATALDPAVDVLDAHTPASHAPIHGLLGTSKGPSPTTAPARPGEGKSSGRRRSTAADPPASAGDSSGTPRPIEAPVGHVALERGLKAQPQRPKFIDGETGQIEHLCGAGLKIGEPSRAHQGREAYFPDELSAIMLHQRMKTTELERQQSRIIPWVFHRDGEPIKDFRTAWKNACRRAGCDGKYFHDFRRTAYRNEAARKMSGIGSGIMERKEGLSEER